MGNDFISRVEDEEIVKLRKEFSANVSHELKTPLTSISGYAEIMKSGMVNREDMIIFENMDFVHHTPMTVLPVGVLCEIDCEKATFKILESGVRT